MLAKLFKHEFRETAKLLVPLNISLIAVAFIGNVMLAFDALNGLTALKSFFIAFYSLTIFALFILTSVYLTVRFYKTMYASQGYLTHTLPVSTVSILNTKIIAASFWLVFAVIATLFSLYIPEYTGTNIDASSLARLKTEIEAVSGMSFWLFWLLLAAMAVLLCVSNVLMVCASVSVGQLFRTHRIPAAIGAYVVFYMVQQVLSVIVLMVLGISQFNASGQISAEMTNVSFSGFYKWLIGLIILQTVVLSIIYYLICFYITRKKLNLE